MRFFGGGVVHQDQIFFSILVLWECFALFLKIKCRLVLFCLIETAWHIKRLLILCINTGGLVVKAVWLINE